MRSSTQMREDLNNQKETEAFERKDQQHDLIEENCKPFFTNKRDFLNQMKNQVVEPNFGYDNIDDIGTKPIDQFLSENQIHPIYYEAKKKDQKDK